MWTEFFHGPGALIRVLKTCRRFRACLDPPLICHIFSLKTAVGHQSIYSVLSWSPSILITNKLSNTDENIISLAKALTQPTILMHYLTDTALNTNHEAECQEISDPLNIDITHYFPQNVYTVQHTATASNKLKVYLHTSCSLNSSVKAPEGCSYIYSKCETI